jgi:Probable cobalt transporter subunit (CbtA)
VIAALLVRGLAAGLAAGVLAGGFGFAVGEPKVERAIGVERASHQAMGPAAAPVVSRSAQRGGLLLAAALYGLAVGGLFALAFAAVRGRVGPRGDWSTAIWLAGLLFVAVALVPALKYPPNPPGVGDPSTISSRTSLYLTMVAITLLGLLAAWRLAGQLSSRALPWVRQLAAAALFTATVTVALIVLPAVDEVPRSYPADLLWSFRLSSLGVQLALWSALGALFGIACERSQPRRGRRRREPSYAPVPGAGRDDG